MNTLKRCDDVTPCTFIGECRSCGSVVQYDSGEVATVGHQFNSHIHSIQKCPVCGKSHIIVKVK